VTERTGEATLRGWLEGRTPPVPPAFLPRLLDGEAASRSVLEESPGSTLDALLTEAREALRSALAGDGEREGAFHLLAADAWITYACEAALASEDATGALRRTLAEILAAAEAR